MASSPITSWQIVGETMEIVTDLIFLVSKITMESDCSHGIRRRLLLGRKVMTKLCCVQSSGHAQLFATPWTAAHQAPLSMGFSRPEYWSGFPCPPPEDLPIPGIEPRSPALQADSLTSEPPAKPMTKLDSILKSRDITLSTKVRIVKAMVFPVILHGC